MLVSTGPALMDQVSLVVVIPGDDDNEDNKEFINSIDIELEK
ncbi:MAG: hypothetical protein WA220_05670 [Candidatus Nitrosopolaris sp.]